MSVYALLADVLVGIHLAYCSFVVFGQLAIMIGWPLGWNWIRNPWFRVAHLAMILIVAFEAVIDFECPLTTWERDLRTLAGQAADEDMSFVGRLLRSVMFFDNSWESVLHMCYYGIAAVVVATVILVPPRFRRQPSAAVTQAPSA